MRLLILDTETTGLDSRQGHRIIEIGCVELIDRRPTGRHLHLYVNPERDIDAGATEVHGFTWDMLRDKPRFVDVAHEFGEFVRGAQWIIHNAPFDIGFLDEELKRANLPATASLAGSVIDTLALAREQFPGKKNNLNALCERLGVANARRTLHGALLDAQLLSEVYLAMTRGQESLTMDIVAPAGSARGIVAGVDFEPVAVRVIAPNDAELEAHHAYLVDLDRASKGACLWLATAAGTH
ncbi:MAG: DNA polymerase III subunit epsilon [Casimicrobiaceae bacterium]